VLLLSGSKDSFSLTKYLKFYEIPIDFSDNVSLLYDEDTELEAFTLERSLIALKGSFVKTTSIYEFSLLENPYSVNLRDVVVFVNDENKSKIILDNLWALENQGYLITCNNKIKSKGQIKVISFPSDELCDINISLSIIRKISSSVNNERSKGLIKELESINNLDQWLISKIQEIDFNSEILLSPVYYPAITLMSKILNKNVRKFYEMPSSNMVSFITTGADAVIVRKKEFELRSSGKNVKEVLLDIDPLLAPIYLVLMTYLFKQLKGGL